MQRSILVFATASLFLVAFLAPSALAADDPTPTATVAPLPTPSDGQGEIVIDPTFITATSSPEGDVAGTTGRPDDYPSAHRFHHRRDHAGHRPEGAPRPRGRRIIARPAGVPGASRATTLDRRCPRWQPRPGFADPSASPGRCVSGNCGCARTRAARHGLRAPGSAPGQTMSTGPAYAARQESTVAPGSFPIWRWVRSARETPVDAASRPTDGPSRCWAPGGTGPVPKDTSARRMSPGRMSGAMSSARPQSPLYTSPVPLPAAGPTRMA